MKTLNRRLTIYMYETLTSMIEDIKGYPVLLEKRQRGNSKLIEIPPSSSTSS